MKTPASIRETVEVCLGQAGTPVGTLTYVRQNSRENTAFAYSASWLADAHRFKVSAELELTADHQVRRAHSPADSPFPFALADTAPDAWGRRVILREHAKRRRGNPALRELNELDYLLAVDDFSRVGAIRLRDQTGNFHRTVEQGQRATPPLVALGRMYQASRAVEQGKESAEDLQYLLGKGTSLGGMRPKCTVMDASGMLAIGKFPSVGDTRSITRGEVLALRLAAAAGIDAARARIEVIEGVAIAIIERFDRTAEGGRIPYMSAASMLQSSRQQDHSYTEIADAIRATARDPSQDARQLWRRIAFNHLITNVDDHLQNHGFLHCGQGQWRLAPAFDINPFPDKDRESKTFLAPDVGPVTSLAPLMDNCAYFSLSAAQAKEALGAIYQAVLNWRATALGSPVGLRPEELDDFAPAFEHEALEEARALI